MRTPLDLLSDSLHAALNGLFHTRKQGVCQSECWCQIAERVTAMYLDEGTSMSKDKFTLQAEACDAREEVVAAAARLVASRIYSDLNPADSSAGWDVELREDLLTAAIEDAYMKSAIAKATA